MTQALVGNRGHFHFSMEVAMVVGVDAAVFLDSLVFWIKTNAANKRNFHEGKYWSYNKLDAFVEIFPCWTRRQVERIINNLTADGYLLSGNFNKNTYDKTKWYTLSEKGLKLLNMTYETPKTPISPNGEIEKTEWGNRAHQIVTAIPDALPVTKQHIKSFYNDEQKKHKAEKPTGTEIDPVAQRIENTKRHDFADSMDRMASEQRHIERHEEIKRTKMPDEIKKLYKPKIVQFESQQSDSLLAIKKLAEKLGKTDVLNHNCYNLGRE